MEHVILNPKLIVLPIDKAFQVERIYSYDANLVPYNIACGISYAFYYTIGW